MTTERGKKAADAAIGFAIGAIIALGAAIIVANWIA